MSKSSLSRRQFIMSCGAAAVASTTSIKALSHLGPSKTPAQLIRFGYAAITWGGNDAQAIKDISELGFPGIQLRSNILTEYGDRPEALRELLAQNKLEFVALSSGGVRSGTATEADELAKHTRHAKFLRAAGGRYLQLTDSSRPKDRAPTAADFKELGKLMSEIGKRAMDLGVAVGYHNHMDSLGENPQEIDRLMDAVDPRYIKLELDIAHYQQGGGDPARAIRDYRDQLLFLHIKDVEDLAPTEGRARNYRFVELGRGRVDLPAVFAALQKVKFKGWAIVELDSVPEKTRTPKEAGQIAKEYLQNKLRLRADF